MMITHRNKKFKHDNHDNDFTKSSNKHIMLFMREKCIDIHKLNKLLINNHDVNSNLHEMPHTHIPIILIHHKLINQPTHFNDVCLHHNGDRTHICTCCEIGITISKKASSLKNTQEYYLEIIICANNLNQINIAINFIDFVLIAYENSIMYSMNPNKLLHKNKNKVKIYKMIICFLIVSVVIMILFAFL